MDWLDAWELQATTIRDHPEGLGMTLPDFASKILRMIPVLRAARVVMEGVDRQALDEGLHLPRWGFEPDFDHRIFRLKDALDAAQRGRT